MITPESIGTVMVKDVERLENDEFLEFYEALKQKFKEKPEDFTTEMQGVMAIFSMRKMLILGKRRDQNIEQIRNNIDLAEQLLDEYILAKDDSIGAETIFTQKYHILAGTEAEDAAFIGGDPDLSGRIAMLNFRYLKALGIM